MRSALGPLLVACVALGDASGASAYSVLAHEAAIDVMWDPAIRPLLLRRYPGTTSDALNRARSFAYGGSVIQDLGYYPFGNKFFSNLLHYVRSGDFVEALLRDARGIDEYAFALGALAHYADDNTGHPEATNRAVPIVYPKLRRKFGERVTYVQAPKQHVIVEFSFDVVQAAGGAYLPDAYRSFIGFRVATPLLDRAVRDTYGLTLSDFFDDEDHAINTYRYAVSQIIPALTTAAWRDKQQEIQRLIPTMERSGFVFEYPRSDYERDYGGDYRKPGLFVRFLGVLYRILPKIGPLKPLSFKAPPPEVEVMFAQSFRAAATRYRQALGAVANGREGLRNTDFDTGRPARHGEYALADDTYIELLKRFEKRAFADVPPALRRDIRGFYGARPSPSPASKKDQKEWELVERSLSQFATPTATSR